MSQYDTHTLRHGDHEVSHDREATINELTAQERAGRASIFNRTLLNHLQNHPELSLADAWDDTENHFAKQNRVRPRSNPYR